MTTDPKPRLFRERNAETHPVDGTVVYRVELNGRSVGWVGDERRWHGAHFGGRRWWACWREDGDTAARWNTFTDGSDHMTRASALDALIHQIRTTQGENA